MADALVNVIFQADTSSTTKAFAALNSEMDGSSQKTVNWTNIQRMNAQAGEFMAQTNYKTAASFKPATQAQREASVAVEEGAQGMEKLAGKIALAYVAYRVLREAAESVKYVITESAGLEAASVRFSNLAGNTEASRKAFEGLKDISKSTGINIVELAQGANTMVEAGVQMTDIPNVMQSIADKADVAGSSVAELTDIYLRLQSRGEISGRQLAMLSKVTGDETGSLSAMYKDMTITMPLLATQAERLAKAAERTREDTEKSLSAHNAFIKATGAEKPLFEAFQKYGGLGGSTMVPYVKVPGMENVQGQGQAQVREVWKELQVGMEQIGKEEHITSQQVSANVRVGAAGFGNEDLMAAVQRSREVAEVDKKRKREDYQDAIKIREEQEKLLIAKQAGQGLLPTTEAVTAAKEADQVGREGETQAAHARHIANDIKSAAQSFGDALQTVSKGIDEATKRIIGYDTSAHPVKGMQPADHFQSALTPGSPRFDWATYKPPGSDPHAEKTANNTDSMAQAVKELVGVLLHVFGPPS